MKNQVLDTRDLSEKRDELKQEIVDAFNENFEGVATIDSYEDLEDFEGQGNVSEFLEDFESEIQEINEIDLIENDLSEFNHGETLIHEDYWVDYCQELCEDVGYISKDFPSWIEIDWESTAQNISADYTTVRYQGEDFYARSV